MLPDGNHDDAPAVVPISSAKAASAVPRTIASGGELNTFALAVELRSLREKLHEQASLLAPGDALKRRRRHLLARRQAHARPWQTAGKKNAGPVGSRRGRGRRRPASGIRRKRPVERAARDAGQQYIGGAAGLTSSLVVLLQHFHHCNSIESQLRLSYHLRRATNPRSGGHRELEEVSPPRPCPARSTGADRCGNVHHRRCRGRQHRRGHQDPSRRHRRCVGADDCELARPHAEAVIPPPDPPWHPDGCDQSRWSACL